MNRPNEYYWLVENSLYVDNINRGLTIVPDAIGTNQVNGSKGQLSNQPDPLYNKDMYSDMTKGQSNYLSGKRQ